MGLKRFMTEEECERWSIKEDCHDPMRMHQKVYGGKVVKLAEAYQKATGKELQNAHSAMADTLAAKDIYYALRGRPELDS
jgi:DNA polymerase-3 subunit epsilon